MQTTTLIIIKNDQISTCVIEGLMSHKRKVRIYRGYKAAGWDEIHFKEGPVMPDSNHVPYPSEPFTLIDEDQDVI